MMTAHPAITPRLECSCTLSSPIPSPDQIHARKCKVLAGLTVDMVDGRDEEDEPFRPAGIPPRGTWYRDRPRATPDAATLCRTWYREWKAARRRTRGAATAIRDGVDAAILAAIRDGSGPGADVVAALGLFRTDYARRLARSRAAGLVARHDGKPPRITDAGRAALAKWEVAS